MHSIYSQHVAATTVQYGYSAEYGLADGRLHA